MTDLQAAELIEKYFKAHWPNWSFPNEETEVWIRKLRKYDFEKAKYAINKFYLAQTKQGKPPPGRLLAYLRQNALSKTDNKKTEIVKLFQICRPDGRRRWFPFSGPKGTPKSVVENHASRVLEDANRKSEGHYIQWFIE